jgi:aldehyde:ferredoxin oxidoreductase
MNLYAGKILVVDLTEKKISVEPLREDWAQKYWGGWGQT